MAECNYWLMKSEPSVYGINHLKDEGTTLWDGIRNYQARTFMRTMKVGDKAFFYHSNCIPPGIIGLMEVVNTNLIDHTQFDPREKYYDPKSSKENPRWDCAKLKYLGQYQHILSLENLRNSYSPQELSVVRKGNRVSILPVPIDIAKDLFKKLGPLL